MSSNNIIHITKKDKEFTVYDEDVDAGGRHLIGKTESFKEARAVAHKYEEEEMVEYGVSIDENCYDK